MPVGESQHLASLNCGALDCKEIAFRLSMQYQSPYKIQLFSFDLGKECGINHFGMIGMWVIFHERKCYHELFFYFLPFEWSVFLYLGNQIIGTPYLKFLAYSLLKCVLYKPWSSHGRRSKAQIRHRGEEHGSSCARMQASSHRGSYCSL